jgi:SAM-dependent methyltransferase
MTVTPVNYRKQDASPEAIARDVDYALQIADFYLEQLPTGRRRLENVDVLELGPGYSLGTAVVLACYGASVSVADRYLSPYDPEYHGPFLRALQVRLAAERPTLDETPIERLLAAEEFVPDVVNGLHLGIEDLEELADGCYDLVLSNAVFEHVENVPRAWSILARITRSGGMGIHQVDFRDHRDFSHPLEYMTLPEEEFRALFREVHGECGNRWRPDAMELVIAEAGFEVARFDANMQADPDYLRDLMPRLAPEFSGMNEQTLQAISGCFVLRRSSLADAATLREVDSLQTLAHGRCRYGFAALSVAGKRVLDLGCGTGLGTRELLAAGAEDVVGVDHRLEALDLAREGDPRGDAAWAAYVHHELDQPLPFADHSFDVVVGLDVLEGVVEQQALCSEIARVLAPEGVAYVSVPNLAFEEFWAGLADVPQPTPDSIPSLEQFVELLAPFPWVDFHGQVDVVASVVLPLDANEAEPTLGELRLPSGTNIGDRGTLAIIARCFATRPVNVPEHPPVAHAFGDDAELHGDALARDRLVFERFRALAGKHLRRDEDAG